MTRLSEKSILEISQGHIDLWKTYFGAENPVGLKISKTATNGVTKRINDTASILFFTRGPEKGEKRPRFEKIACEPSLGAGPERQGSITKIPVRGLKPIAELIHTVFYLVTFNYQNPRKGTETF